MDTDKKSFVQRIIGVLTVDSDTFREIEHDKSATGQAVIVVVVSALLAAIGGSVGSIFFGVGLGVTSSTVYVALATAAWAIIAWLLWSAVTLFLGTRLYKGDSNFGEMMRVIGFAYAPLAFQIFHFIPLFGRIVPLLVAVWALGAVLVGVKEGLDIDMGKTLVVVLVGWFIYLIGMGVVLYILPS